MAYPVTLNGRTYTLADFEGTNYVDGFPDALEDFVTQAGNIYTTTSTSSVAIGTGSKTFTVADSGKPYIVGTPLRIADSAAPSTNWIDGIVTAYSGTTLTVNAIAYAGSGTKTAWSINIGGSAVAYTGTLPIAQGGTGATTEASARTNLDVYSKAEADSRFLNVSGEASNVTMTGNVTIGDASGDTLTVNATADFNTGINVDGTVTADGLTVDGNLSLVNGAWTVSASAADNSVNLDASGNLLVGKTTSDFSTVGLEWNNGGQLRNVRNGASVAWFNRLTSDGAIVDFGKDGTTVGSIASQAGKIAIMAKASYGIKLYDQSGADIVHPINTSGLEYDGQVSLGYSASRFKDLYLSGGVYLGGTGAANLLDDYEEGTWTPDLNFGGSNAGITYATRYGNYTRIGRMCQVNFRIFINNRGTAQGTAKVGGLPFGGNGKSGGSIFYAFYLTGINGNITLGNTGGTSTQIEFFDAASNGTAALDHTNWTSSGLIEASMVYEVI